VSWKLFFQIVLLVIIASIIMSSVKIAMHKCGLKYKMLGGMHPMCECPK